MNSVHYQSLSFQLEGQFVGFINKPNGRLKSLRLMLNDKELHIKLDKELRCSLENDLSLGDWIQVLGKRKFKGSCNNLKFKAFQVNRLSCNIQCEGSLTQNHEVIYKKRLSDCTKKGKILLCNKSGCAKNGSEKLYQELQKTIYRLGLENSVTIQKTSCQKRCKKAPNMILMPRKEKCSNPQPKSIANLLRDHYLTSMD
ncbi:(2Fe-2S) ferredoxin domain-containing protein [Cyanobacterium sp. uoEpiScrs1]|uniref:(2Fe-2S) ferredoxin domain-containing protein n=1 Tax=Cyanobacterium sp. uoEpiScrs1 TaxID=2976343 RepID=UPI00226A179E|nr:(2Fe-2S) ferredoxin domain-containing protein [Cyanobacterium sp. uoEpiScrs1]